MSDKRILPTVDNLNRPFWEAAKKHELRLQKCLSCGHCWFPPSQRCPKCLKTDLEWALMSGKGKVWSWIVMWQRYFPSFENPYNVAFVELEEGPRLMTSLVDYEESALRCDLPVEVVFDDVTEEISLPRFRPAKQSLRGR